MLTNKTILITSGTDSFERSIIIYSRDEMKQWNMANK